MEQSLIFLLLCCIMLIVILWVIGRKKQDKLDYAEIELKLLKNLKKDDLKQYFREEWNEEEKRFGLKKKSLLQEYEQDKREVDLKLHNLETILKEKEKRYEEVNQDLNLYKEGKIKEIDGVAAEYEQRKHILISQSVDKYRDTLIEQANKMMGTLTTEIDFTNKELEEIKAELEIERSKRAAINEEIRKAEEKEKYNEIHSVQLTDNEKEDIHFLLSLEDRMHNKQVLYKLVWSTYLQQAYKNTFHNILGSRDPKNVIYCIENINTGKKYIGKTSAEVSKRWTEHIKTSLNIGTIKTTNIHKALYNHWDEFIFYIIAETEKDKLSEMEKYYIKFYESDKYGYNIKAGG